MASNVMWRPPLVFEGGDRARAYNDPGKFLWKRVFKRGKLTCAVFRHENKMCIDISRNIDGVKSVYIGCIDVYTDNEKVYENFGKEFVEVYRQILQEVKK